ncbi:DUF488 domain-containing protein [Candidimonas nitroreducens]|uniref:DNA repair protein n=1 Tax=Candidimonas nitroreducens TaxID=683354 RepID=A0A225MX83_9BURK|nr:DNA repair protein [Candidimonas nitroreducens]
MPSFFTIGHSNRSLAEFAGLLVEAGVALLADIRKMPMSRANPQFNTDVLPDELAPYGIAYEHIAALGGLRGKARGLPADTNGYWTNASFHNYADYAFSAQFQAGLEHLLKEGRARRCAIMCSEAVWWRCHRRIVADYLMARGANVFHIMGPGRIEPARITLGAVTQASGTIAYPAAQQSLL